MGPVLDAGSVLDAALHPMPPLGSDGGVDPYPFDRVVEVELSVAEEDWERIRAEGRSINDSYSGCKDRAFDYSFVPAAVRVDGEAFTQVGLRKKGYLGSISVVKPSLRLDFSEFVSTQSYFGHKDLTLNNSRSDRSLLRQCLAYDVFLAAGIPAPRCGFARVQRNGRALGTYVNVEPVKKPMLRRFFASDEGNLYEGNSGADFRPGHLDYFEKKTNERDPSRAELERVAEALESEGEELVKRLEPLIDLEQFFTYWAVETVIGHWDSYAGNLNNFFVYYDPTTRKLSFLPWGPDDSFSRTHAFLPSGQRPIATYAYSRLSNRLYVYGPTRERYYAALRKVLATGWNETRLLLQIERMRMLLGGDADARAIQSLRTFVMNRRADVERELANPNVPWTLGERQLRPCNEAALSPVSASFRATWGGPDTVHPDNTLTLSIDGVPQRFTQVSVGAGPSLVALLLGGGQSLRITGTREDGSAVSLQFSLNATPPSQPGIVLLHGYETYGTASTRASDARIGSQLGYVGRGRLLFEQVSMQTGAPVVGRLEGEFVQSRQVRMPTDEEREQGAP
jgi:spore coat protein H